ncbi:histidine kinase [Nonomuraea sp. NPDC050310]|uniref:sensor histidine kinase n=1 Tax=Nonomuraea sp. NPDC050310 TaxID=3154935 RepID=UPI0033EFE785
MHNRRALLIDSALAIGLAVVSVSLFVLVDSGELAGSAAGDLLRPVREPDGGAAVLVGLACLPVAVRRRWPLAALCASLLPDVVLVITGYGFSSVAHLVLLYSVAAYRGLAVALGGLLVSLLAYALAVVSAEELPVTVAVHVLQVAILAGVWGMGRGLRLRRAYLEELKDRASRLERAREADARAAKAEERSRIARELHDVVAHHVSVMTVQAAAARRVLTEDPEQAREALSAIESTGRVAMREMRDLVGVLRSPAERGPQPGMESLPMLVEQMREAGLATDLVVEGEAAPLPAGVDLAAYRLIQEGLTNSLRHAGTAARAVVTVRHRPGELDVEVLDDGQGAATAGSPERGGPGDRSAGERGPGEAGRGERGRGHGLVGIRERVAIYGGILKVGPRPGGGFEIQARFPLS